MAESAEGMTGCPYQPAVRTTGVLFPSNFQASADGETINMEWARVDCDIEGYKVEIENEEGMTLTTDSLNWRRDEHAIDTDDWVQAHNADMQINAKGLSADTQFQKVGFEEDVAVQFPDAEGKNPITVNCNGPLEIEYNQGKAVFHNDVVVTDEKGKLFSDKATLFFDSATNKIIKIVAEGHVKIIQDENVTFAQKATYFGQEGRVVLEGAPRLIYFPKEEDESVLP